MIAVERSYSVFEEAGVVTIDIWLFTLTSEQTSGDVILKFHDIIVWKSQRHSTTYNVSSCIANLLTTRDFYPVLGEIY